MKYLKKSNLIIFSILLIGFPSHVSPFELILPDTGQELCYDWENLMDECPSEGEDFYGQDGNYTINPPDLNDNGDGTVTDNLTGLIWEQKTDDGGSRDKDNAYTWKDALAYCENLILGGHDDWRLPNSKELERLVDLESSSPAIDTSYFPNTNNALYWTSTTCSGCHKMKAFAIDFSDGELYYANKYRNDIYDELYVRCVRTAEATFTTTTTTIPSQPCPVEEIYEYTSDEVQLLRSFREKVLNKTSEGQEIIRLYYQWSPVIVKIMKEDENFKEEVKKIIDRILLIIDLDRTRE